MYKKLLLLAFLSLPMFVSAFEIGALQETPPSANMDDSIVDLKVKKVVSQKNHEKLTALALLCLAKENEGRDDLKNKPLKCIEKFPDLANLVELNHTLEAFLNTDSKKQGFPAVIDEYKRLLYDVRWPDDPVRFLSTNKRSVPTFVALIEKGCKDRLEEKGGVLSINFDGYLCTSHYGKLQFLHAMKYKDPSLDSEKDFDARTYSLMKEWAEFTFEIASNVELQQENYCTYWNQDTHPYPNLASVMYESSLSARLCKDDRFNYHRLYWPWYKNYRAWQVSTTFTFKCSNAFGSDTCDVIRDKDTEASFAALGSIIHVIQDSYSTAHTTRVSQCDHEALVVTNPVESFQDYSQQASDIHALSDKWPKFIGDGLTLDPITASAQVIWLKNNQSSADVSITDILEQVINGITEN